MPIPPPNPLAGAAGTGAKLPKLPKDVAGWAAMAGAGAAVLEDLLFRRSNRLALPLACWAGTAPGAGAGAEVVEVGACWKSSKSSACQYCVDQFQNGRQLRTISTQNVRRRLCECRCGSGLVISEIKEVDLLGGCRLFWRSFRGWSGLIPVSRARCRHGCGMSRGRST